MTRTLFSLFALVAAIAVTCTCAFVPQSNMAFTPRTQPSLHMTVLTYNGKKKDFKAGSPLSNACKALGVPVKYSCRKGDCATCSVQVAGRMVKACQGKVPEEPRLKSLQEKGLEIRA